MSTAEESQEKSFDAWADETVRQMQLDGIDSAEIERAKFAMDKTKLSICGVPLGQAFVNVLSRSIAQRSLQVETNIPVWIIMHPNGNPEIVQSLKLPEKNPGEWIPWEMPSEVADFALVTPFSASAVETGPVEPSTAPPEPPAPEPGVDESDSIPIVLNEQPQPTPVIVTENEIPSDIDMSKESVN